MTQKQVSAEEFVRAWQTSESTEEFCQKTGMSKKTASSRAGAYRRRYQIPLKYYPNTPPKLDVHKLRRLAEELA